MLPTAEPTLSATLPITNRDLQQLASGLPGGHEASLPSGGRWSTGSGPAENGEVQKKGGKASTGSPQSKQEKTRLRDKFRMKKRKVPLLPSHLLLHPDVTGDIGQLRHPAYMLMSPDATGVPSIYAQNKRRTSHVDDSLRCSTESVAKRSGSFSKLPPLKQPTPQAEEEEEEGMSGASSRGDWTPAKPQREKWWSRQSPKVAWVGRTLPPRPFASASWGACLM